MLASTVAKDFRELRSTTGRTEDTGGLPRRKDIERGLRAGRMIERRGSMVIVVREQDATARS